MKAIYSVQNLRFADLKIRGKCQDVARIVNRNLPADVTSELLPRKLEKDERRTNFRHDRKVKEKMLHLKCDCEKKIT